MKMLTISVIVFVVFISVMLMVMRYSDRESRFTDEEYRVMQEAGVSGSTEVVDGIRKLIAYSSELKQKINTLEDRERIENDLMRPMPESW